MGLPAVRQKPGLLRGAGHLLAAAWNPRPVDRPEPDPELTGHAFLTRAAEVLRYHMLMLEYSLSRGGGLRAWFKLNLLLGLVLAVPGILVVPAVTLVLSGLASWSALLLLTLRNLAFAMLWGILCLVIIVTFVFAAGQTRNRARRGRSGW